MMYARPLRRTIRQFLSRLFSDFSELTIFISHVLRRGLEHRNRVDPSQTLTASAQAATTRQPLLDQADAEILRLPHNSAESLRPFRKLLILRVA